MTLLSLPAGQLLAATTPTATGDTARTVEGILVPWGEVGRTNLGPVRVRRGAVQLSAGAKVVGIYGHDRERAVSRVLATEDRPEGLWGRIRVGRGALGDQLLAEIEDGVRDGLSVELDDLTLDPASGDVTAGRLDFVAHVPVGAYSSALAAAMAAQLSSTPPTQPDGVSVPDQTTTPPPATPPAPAPAATAAFTGDELAALRALLAAPGATPTPVAAPVGLTAATVPGGLSTASVPAPAGGAPTGLVRRMAELQAAQATGNTGPQLAAALADITNTGLNEFQSPQALGQELWTGGGYTRRFVPLMTQKQLTSWKFGGWRWTQRPEVGDYAGDKAEIPTNPVAVEPIEGSAQRVAGGWDVDRKFRDFGDASFWEGFYAAQAESYSERTDEIAAAFVVASAQNITVDANVPAEYATVNTSQADVLRATALGSAILQDTPNVRRAADYVLMNTGDWLGLMDFTGLELPAFLALLGVSPASFMRSPLVPAGAVILGVTPALSFYELGGGSPIRVEALDVARAGIDSAVYGYVGTLVNRPGGVISVPLTQPAPTA